MRMRNTIVMVLLVVGMASVASAAATYEEDFDYTVGTQNLNGQGPWGPQAVSAHANFDVYSGSLSYTDGDGDSVATSGGHVGKRDDTGGITRTDSSNRPLSTATQALFGTTQTIYIGAFFGHGTGSLVLRGGTGHMALETIANSASLQTRMRSSGGGSDTVYGPTMSFGATPFWGIKIDNVAGGNETYTSIINPALSNPNWGAPNIVAGPVVDLGVPTELFLEAWARDPTGITGTEHFGALFDEIRIGTSWADVAPIVADNPGDVNKDQFIGGYDLTQIIQNWGMTGAAWADGDTDGPGGVPDGLVGADDYAAVLTNWGTNYAPEPPGEAVPEPATLALLIIGGLSLIRRR